MNSDNVVEWFGDFIVEHIARHPGAKLPEPDTDNGKVIYESWVNIMRRQRGINHQVMTMASERLLMEPASDKKHFSMLIEFAGQIVISRRPGGSAQDLGTREGAERASRNCEFCSGSGLLVVFNSRPGNGQPASVGAHCACPHGRWIRQWYVNKNDHETLQRIPSLEDVTRGRGCWQVEPLDVNKPVNDAPY